MDKLEMEIRSRMNDQGYNEEYWIPKNGLIGVSEKINEIVDWINSKSDQLI